MKRILIKGYYGQDNLGDEILLLSILRWCRSRDLVAHVSVGDRKARLEEVVELAGAKVSFFDSTFLREAQCLRYVDAFLIGGGGLFPAGRFGLPLRLLLLACLAAIMGKPTVMIGVGVNPIKSFATRSIWKLLGRICSVITVRDENSLAVMVETLGDRLAALKVARCADLVFNLSPNDFSNANVNASEERALALVVAQPWSASERRRPDIAKRYERLQVGLAECIEKAVGLGWSVKLIPFYYPGDLELATEVAARCSADAVSVHQDSSLESRIRSISSSSLVLTMRFHGLVLGALFRKKILAIAYDYKMDELARELNLDDHLVHLGIRSSEFYRNEVDVDFKALWLKLETVILAPANTRYDERRARLVSLSQQNFIHIEQALRMPVLP